MFESIKNWWNRDKIRQAELEARFVALETKLCEKEEALGLAAIKIEQVEEELNQAEEELTIFRQQAEEDEARRNGTEPWVEVRSAKMDPVKGIQIELDWNDAFVQYLRDNGLTGRDDETVVQKWLAFLYEDLINRLESHVIETTEKGTVSDIL